MAFYMFLSIIEDPDLHKDLQREQNLLGIGSKPTGRKSKHQNDGMGAAAPVILVTDATNNHLSSSKGLKPEKPEKDILDRTNTESPSQISRYNSDLSLQDYTHLRSKYGTLCCCFKWWHLVLWGIFIGLALFGIIFLIIYLFR